MAKEKQEKPKFLIEVKNTNFLEKMLRKCDVSGNTRPAKHVIVAYYEKFIPKRCKRHYYVETKHAEEAVNKIFGQHSGNYNNSNPENKEFKVGFL